MDDATMTAPNEAVETAPIGSEVNATTVAPATTATEATTPTTETAPIIDTVPTAEVKEDKGHTVSPQSPDIKDLLAKTVKDEKALKLINHALDGGDLTEYFKAYNTDYNQMAPQELLRLQMTEQYKGLAPDKLEKLIQHKLEKVYQQGEFADEDDKEVGAIQMEADLKAYREQKINEQKDFVVSPIDLLANQKAEQEKMDGFVKEFKTQMSNSPLTQKFLADKVLTIGSGETAFNYGVADPKKVMDFITDPASAASELFNADGSPKVQEQLMLGAFMADMHGYSKRLIEHGRAIGNISNIKENGNIQQPQAAPVTTGGKMTIEQEIAAGLAKRISN